MRPRVITIRAARNERPTVDVAADGRSQQPLVLSAVEDTYDLFAVARSIVELAGYRMIPESYTVSNRSVQADFERDGGADVTNSFTGTATGPVVQAGDIHHALNLR